MEYLNGGDLYSLLRNLGCLEEDIVRVYIAEVVSSACLFSSHESYRKWFHDQFIFRSLLWSICILRVLFIVIWSLIICWLRMMVILRYSFFFHCYNCLAFFCCLAIWGSLQLYGLFRFIEQLTDFGLSKVGLINSTDDLSGPGTSLLDEEESRLPTSEHQLERRKKRSAVGTPDYLAPEILLGTGHGSF